MRDGTKEITADSDRVKYWMTCGAQPSDKVSWLLGKAGVLPPKPHRNSIESAIPKALRPKKVVAAKPTPAVKDAKGSKPGTATTTATPAIKTPAKSAAGKPSKGK